MSPAPYVRPIAICLCRHDGRILVMEGYDRSKRQAYHRSLGGTIEFGERAAETVVREFREELGVELVDVCFLATLENIFTYEGETGHEIVFVFDGRLADSSIYMKERLEVNENGIRGTAVWRSIGENGPADIPLYPDGLLDLIAP